MIKAVDLSKHFDKNIAVDSINFEADSNQIVGFIGSNGAGKTTTMRMLATIMKPTKGTAFINGYDVVKDADKTRASIGILFGSETGLYKRLTGRENIEYFGRLNGMDKITLNKRIHLLAERFEIDSYIDKLTFTYSRGMKQKVIIVRSIVHNPDVIMFDEPDTGLDIIGTQLIYDFIKSCKNEGKTILFSSHSVHRVSEISDKILMIHKGKLIENTSKDKLFSKYGSDKLDEIFFNIINKNERINK